MKSSNADLKRSWAKYTLSLDISADWRKRYVRHVENWLGWLGVRRKNALGATAGDALEFWADTAGDSPSTKKQKLTALNAFYKWISAYTPTRNPFAAVPRPQKRLPKPRPIVSEEELVDLVIGWKPARWTEYRDQAMVAVLVSTGCRVSECCGMDVEHIDFRRKAIYIEKAKNEKPGWGPLVPKAIEIVRSYLDGVRPVKAEGRESALWLNNRGARVRPESARATVKRICAEVGIEVRLTPHGIRASAITAVYRASRDVLAARDFGRHENVQTTVDHYIRQLPDEVVEIAEAFNPFAQVAATKEE